MFNLEKLLPLVGNWTHMDMDHFEGCILRYLLAPSPHLDHLTRSVSGSSPRDPALGAGLLRLLTMHVRTGDSAFFSMNRSASGKWAFATEIRRTLFDVDAPRLMSCLQRASAITLPRSGSCLGCAVVSDSEAVLQCASRALEQPLVVDGTPIQIVGNARDVSLSTAANIDKVFLDWWLLARSQGIVLVGGSSFLQTAMRLRQATGSWGFTIDARNESEMRHPDGRWRRICDGSLKPWQPPPSCVTAAERALNPSCRKRDKYWRA